MSSPETVTEATIPPEDREVIAQTRVWVERAVIGLNLCPFAQAVYARRQIRFWVTPATSTRELLADLGDELRALAAADPTQCETTLLIHPRVLTDFFDYNQFLGEADQLLRRLGFEGTFQIASFHPQYQFAGSEPDDITNYTNRSPYPLLHLLREASVTAAISGPEEATRIVKRNLATLRRLGPAGWRQLEIPTANPPRANPDGIPARLGSPPQPS